MKYLLITIFSFVLFSFSTAPTEDIEQSECYAAFDIVPTPSEKGHLVSQERVSIEKLLSLKEVNYSLNTCSGERFESKPVLSFRAIVAPAEGPASMYGGKESWAKAFESRISNLVSGDRVIFEGIKIKEGDVEKALAPVVFTIE